MCYAPIPCAVLLITPEKDCDVVYMCSSLQVKQVHVLLRKSMESESAACKTWHWQQSWKKQRKDKWTRLLFGCGLSLGGSILVQTTNLYSHICTSATLVNVCWCQGHQ